MRRIVFEERAVDRREANHVEVFSIEEIECHFVETLTQIMKQIELADRLEGQGYDKEAGEILRSQIVQVEGAYDYFLHELLRFGVTNLYKGNWEDKGEKYMELQLSMRILKRAMEGKEDDWVKEWVTEKYSYVTLMDYEIFVREVCGILGISVKEVADLAFYKLRGKEKTTKTLENEIKEIYKRRNQIAHQSDRKMGTAKREKISKEYVLEKIGIIKKIVMALCEIARKRSNREEIPRDVGMWIKDLYSQLMNVLRKRIIQKL